MQKNMWGGLQRKAGFAQISIFRRCMTSKKIKRHNISRGYGDKKTCFTTVMVASYSAYRERRHTTALGLSHASLSNFAAIDQT